MRVNDLPLDVFDTVPPTEISEKKSQRVNKKVTPKQQPVPPETLDSDSSSDKEGDHIVLQWDLPSLVVEGEEPEVGVTENLEANNTIAENLEADAVADNEIEELLEERSNEPEEIETASSETSDRSSTEEIDGELTVSANEESEETE